VTADGGIHTLSDQSPPRPIPRDQSFKDLPMFPTYRRALRAVYAHSRKLRRSSWRETPDLLMCGSRR